MVNPVFSELIQIIEEEYTKEDTVKFMNEVLEQFIKLGTKGITELSEAIEEYAQDNEICPLCGGEHTLKVAFADGGEAETTFTIIKDNEYDLDTHNNIITVTKVCDNCNCEINF